MALLATETLFTTRGRPCQIGVLTVCRCSSITTKKKSTEVLLVTLSHCTRTKVLSIIDCSIAYVQDSAAYMNRDPLSHPTRV
jgi:hypothetical protein